MNKCESDIVSVIIPTFNRAGLIVESLQSVLNQTFSNFEIIVVDDGSTDGTESVVKSLKDSRIRYIFQQNTGLPAIARNVGIRESSGEYIAFLDSDDLWLPDKLEKQIEYLSINEDVGLIGTNAIEFPGDIIMRPHIRKPTRVKTERLIRYNELVNSSVVLRKDVIQKIGPLDEDPDIRAAEDWEYWIRASRVCGVVVIPDIFVRYRVHGNNINALQKMSATQQSEYLHRYMRVLSRFKNIPELQKHIAMFYRKHEAYLSSTQCREQFLPTFVYLQKVLRSKALFRTKIKLVGWYFGFGLKKRASK